MSTKSLLSVGRSLQEIIAWVLLIGLLSIPLFGMADTPKLDRDIGLHIPTEFTPDGDGKDDTWVISGIQNHNNYLILIYDSEEKWLLTLDDYQNDWNGSVKNKKLPAGKYSFQIVHQNGRFLLNGKVSIIH